MIKCLFIAEWDCCCHLVPGLSMKICLSLLSENVDGDLALKLLVSFISTDLESELNGPQVNQQIGPT